MIDLSNGMSRLNIFDLLNLLSAFRLWGKIKPMICGAVGPIDALKYMTTAHVRAVLRYAAFKTQTVCIYSVAYLPDHIFHINLHSAALRQHK